MESSFWKHFHFLLLLDILINFTSLTLSQEFPRYNCTGNYTNDSPYQTNLNTLFSNLPTNIDKFGFYNSSFGKNPNQVNVIALCRGDIVHKACQDCIQNATTNLKQTCPNSKEAIGWYENCTLRYSNWTISATLTTEPSAFLPSPNSIVSTVDSYNQDLRDLLNNLSTIASSGDDHLKFSFGNISAPDFSYIYGLMQCTPDLSKDDCNNCLVDAVSDIKRCCDKKTGGRVLKPSCNLRYETNRRFFEYTPTYSYQQPPPPPASPAIKDSKDDNNDMAQSLIIIMVASSLGFVIFVILCTFIWLRNRRQRKQRETVKTTYRTSGDISDINSLQYDFDIIRGATNDFNDANKLGRGGFGVVYKGVLPNGQEIAVKRLSQNSGQGEQEFKNEVMLLAKLQHRNLVRLLGFCLEGTERLLIYEFVPNSSLDQLLFDPVKRAILDWESRDKIICGIAKGLLYLHEDSRLRIIHRDLKAANILLENDMSPKLADFGMARLFARDETHGSTKKIVGTYGYMAPEYAMHGHFSVKSDVFSFGVLILEIVSGRKNKNFRNDDYLEDLLSHAWKLWREGQATSLIDPILRSSSGSTREMLRYIHIGLLCVQENGTERPTMALIFRMLTSLSLDLPRPSEPAFFHERTVSGVTNHSEKSNIIEESVSRVTSEHSNASQNEVSITELYPR